MIRIRRLRHAAGVDTPRCGVSFGSMIHIRRGAVRPPGRGWRHARAGELRKASERLIHIRRLRHAAGVDAPREGRRTGEEFHAPADVTA